MRLQWQWMAVAAKGGTSGHRANQLFSGSWGGHIPAIHQLIDLTGIQTFGGDHHSQALLPDRQSGHYSVTAMAAPGRSSQC